MLGNEAVVAHREEGAPPSRQADSGSLQTKGDPSFRVAFPRRVIQNALSTEVSQRLEAGRGHEPLSLIVRARATAPVPPLPSVPDETRYAASTGERASLHAARFQAFDAFADERRSSQARLAVEVIRLGGVVREQFVLCNCFLATLPASAVESLSQRDDLEFVELDRPGSAGDIGPDNEPGNDMSVVRSQIGSDAFFNAGFKGQTFVGVIDTGVDDPHVLLSNPGRLDFLRDCTHGNNDCENAGNPSFSTTDSCGGSLGNGHGTKAAAAITGNANRGEPWRGISEAVVDSWRISKTNECVSVDTTATLRAFDAAARWGD